jgi:DNA excision repair protein ERCC-2
MMVDIYSALSNGKSILANAPTGTGKTDAAIGAALTYAMEHDLSLFFLTPKTSQHRIAVEALSGIRKANGMDIGFVDFVGKSNLCINGEVSSLGRDAFYGACDAKVKAGKCSYFNKARDMSMDVPENLFEASLEGHNSLLNASRSKGVCAYEISSFLAKKAKVVIADYAHLLNPYTKSTFMKKISGSLSNAVIIWDEAHNILGSASGYLSSSLSLNMLESAQKELQAVDSKIDLGYLKFAVERTAQKKLRAKKEAFAGIEDLPEELVKDGRNLSEQLEKAGLEYSEKTRAKRSSLIRLSRFITAWQDSDESVARIISKEGKQVRITLGCLYPEKSVSVFKEAYANVFMSATLVPLRMYAELFGIGDAECKDYKGSFPQKNRVSLIDDSVTTRYENRSVEQYRKIAARLMTLKGRVPGNVAVFFPSFALLDDVYRYMSDVVVFRQRPEMKSSALEELLCRFRKSDDSLLFGVMGGSLSEGVDYSGNVIKCIAVVGVPLEKPNLELSAKIEYYEKRFEGRGNSYAYTIPAVIRAVQAAGRAIRSETDRAVIVFMDSRYRWNIYSSLIRNSMPEMEVFDIKKIDRFWAAEKETA